MLKATLTSAGATVVPSGFNKSGAVVAIAHANCMVMLPGGSRGFKAGHTVDIILTESDAAEEELLYDFTNCRLQKSGKTTLMRHIFSFLQSHMVIQLLLLNIMGMVRKIFNYRIQTSIT